MQPGGPHTHVVKTRPHREAEAFDQHKLHLSIVAACLASGAPTGHAESMARRVTEEVVIWLESRPEVTSDDLRRTASKYLKTYHPDASYLYEHHRSTL
jgi:transcriptional regulator NrdR family protein